MVEKNLIIRDAVVISRNFEGRAEPPYTPAGKRTFTVRLDVDTAEQLARDGWNVKIRQSDPEEEAVGYLNVAVSYGGKTPPKIIQITKRNGKDYMTPLNENTVKLIDSAEIEDIKLEIRPYNWEMNGRTGVKAYLKTMYFTLIEDAFASEYNFDDIPDIELPFDEE